jgi:hypothetical protein
MTREPKKPAGFVLLLSLLLICLVATLLAGLARYSLERSLQLSDRAQEQQQRWAEISLRRSLVQSAAAVFHQVTQQARQPGETVASPYPLERSFFLGDCELFVRIEDESTKVNLNRLQTFRHQEALLSSISQLSSAAHQVWLRPTPTGGHTFQRLPLASWGQVFDLKQLPHDQVLDWSRHSTRFLTLWGNGHVNLHFAAPEVLRAVLGPEVRPSTLKKLFEQRQKSPEATVADLIKTIEPSDAERRELSRWLADTSSTFSIWMETRNGPRRAVQLTVVTQQPAAVETFGW